MQQQGMRRFGLILICVLAIVAGAATAGTYKFTDGTQIVGEPISLTETGVVFKESDDTVLPRYTWDKLTPDAIKTLYGEVKNPRDRALLQPFVDILPEETPKVKEVVVKAVATPERPTQRLGIFAIFGSSLGLMIVLILYTANFFAAFHVALFRRQPVSRVCGLAAIPLFGVLSPIIFISMRPKLPPPEIIESAPAAVTEQGIPLPQGAAQSGGTGAAPTRAPIAMAGMAAAASPEEAPAPAAEFPAPIVFVRGEFTFNRRFFETKFPGFFRAIRADSEKDLVLLLKTSRGDFVGRRITRITPNELYLQVFSNNATADEMIPFIEVMEAQVRHKDAI
jgi:hypothetical protein